MSHVGYSRFFRGIMLKRRLSFALAATTILTTPVAIADVLSSSPNEKFSVVTANDEIEIVDNETRASFTLASLDGSHDVMAFWAPNSDKLLSSVAHGHGFELFGARLEGRSFTQVSIQDPGDALYNLIHDKLDIKVGSGEPKQNYYTVLA
jgi:hypothetical protein